VQGHLFRPSLMRKSHSRMVRTFHWILSLLPIVLLLIFASLPAYAEKDFDVNDCIIDGMKGVASDAAAKMIKEACERKQQERPEWRVEQYMKQLGKVVDANSLTITALSTDEEAGFHSLVVRNNDPDRIVTFIRIKATPAPIAGKECDYLQTKFEVFRVAIRPGGSAKLLYPNRGGQESCVVLVTVFARQPEKTDIPSLAPVKALSRDPLSVERR
jgi:hypothetical protein